MKASQIVAWYEAAMDEQKATGGDLKAAREAWCEESGIEAEELARSQVMVLRGRDAIIKVRG